MKKEAIINSFRIEEEYKRLMIKAVEDNPYIDEHQVWIRKLITNAVKYHETTGCCPLGLLNSETKKRV